METFVTYNKLWKMLIDRGLNKKELSSTSGVSASTISKMSKNEMVNMQVLVKLCKALHCDIGDIVSVNPPAAAAGE